MWSPRIPSATAAAGVCDESFFEGAIPDGRVEFELRIERLFGFAVFNELHASHQPQSADIADDGMSIQVIQLLQQVLPHDCAMFHQIMLPDVVQYSGGDRTGKRILTVGMPMDEDAVAFLDGLMYSLLGNDAVNGCIAAGQTFTSHQHVRNHPPVVDGEMLSGSPDSGHDLIDNQQNIVAVADFADPLEIPVTGHQGPGSSSHHRLGHERRHRIRTFVEDGFLQIIGAFQLTGNRACGRTGTDSNTQARYGGYAA